MVPLERIMVDSNRPRAKLETAPESVSEFATVGGKREGRNQHEQLDEPHSTRIKQRTCAAIRVDP